MIKLTALILLATMGTLTLTAMADDSNIYRPLYEVDIPYNQGTKGTILADYLYAHRSKTTEEALKRWKSFTDTYLDKPDPEIDDLTALTLLRQATYELARLYYLLGNVKMGDEQLLKTENLVSYTMPNKEQGNAWCHAYGYCKPRLPNNLLQPKPKAGAAEQ